ncbi:MAG TPA: FAD-dependent oxidoreductase [Nitrospiraceae bacterium]|nr:FAD-dependent oxidoreductase [Nitrospiraceae bacterium]
MRDHTTSCLELLTKGLGRYNKSTKCHVAIVGAGMAGLVAAWLLQRAGLQVRLYEASQRVGGRVRTLREGFSSGLYAEAGAMRIPAPHKLTLHLCKSFGLQLTEFIQNNSKAFMYINGERGRRSDYLKGKCNFGRPYSPNKTAEDIVEKVLNPLTQLYKDKDRRIQLDKISWGEYLHAFVHGSRNPITGDNIPKGLKLTHGDIDLIGFVFGAAEFRASLLEAVRDHMVMGSGTKYQILGGMDLLPRSFITPTSANQTSLVDSVRYHARVTQIHRVRPGKEYQVMSEHTLTKLPLPDETADHVILAAPFSALTHVRFGHHVLPPERLHAIRNLHYENATKIVLEFSRRFWEKDHQIYGGRSITDLPIRWTYYPATCQNPLNSDRGLLLASYTWGDDSLRWGPLNESDRIRFALRGVAELHNMKQDECEKLLVGGMSHSWAEDEYTFGAFALFEPYQEKELFDNVWKRHDRIHFAGEHTSLKHAWIEGAVESGIRAAREVFKEASA